MLCVLIVTPSLADDGRLMDPFPPNVQAKNFELYDLQGNKKELSSFLGKYILVNFWAISCNVCKSEMTTLQDAYELLDDENFIVLSIHAGDDIEGASAVVKLNNITYPVLMDMDLTLGHWGIPILPTTFLVDPEGNILYRAVGSRVWNSPFMIDFLQGNLNSQNLKVSNRESGSHYELFNNF
ncbi:MAG: TlpA family protein disulfide reductase [Gammaproteobacteria bacterium]